MAILVIISNYLHDMFTGLFLASAWLIFSSRNLLVRSKQGETFYILYKAWRPLVKWSFVAVLLFGVPRMIFFKQYEFIPAVSKGLIIALVCKHIILGSVFILSVVLWNKVDKEFKSKF